MLLSPGDQFGQEWFVDQVNGNDGNDGLSWATAFSTIATAVTANATYRALAANVNSRNRIYIGGGWFTEVVTALPWGCDIVGCGTQVGYPTRMAGLWTIATKVIGCRIYNLHFNVNSATTVLSLTDSSWYNEFHNCEFYAGTSSGYALYFHDSNYTIIDKCRFIGHDVYTTAIYCDVEGFHNCKITNNTICASASGIYLKSNLGTAQTVIANNYIFRSQAASGALLAVGIDKQTEASLMIANNWIVAEDGISGTGNENYTVCNWLVQSGTGLTETSTTTTS